MHGYSPPLGPMRVHTPVSSSLAIVPPATAMTNAKAAFRLRLRSDFIVASLTLLTAAAVALALPCGTRNTFSGVPSHGGGGGVCCKYGVSRGWWVECVSVQSMLNRFNLKGRIRWRGLQKNQQVRNRRACCMFQFVTEIQHSAQHAADMW